MRFKQSILTYCVATGLLIFALIAATRFNQVTQSSWLPDTVPVMYLAVSGLSWCILSIPALVGILWRKAWSGRYIRITATMILFWIWIERIVLTRSEYAQRTRPFFLLASLAIYLMLQLLLSRLQLSNES